MIEQQDTKRFQIQRGNDLLRQTLHPFLGKVILTRKVAEHPNRDVILDSVKSFKDFCISNDPYNEHDFAFFEVTTDGKSEKFCFKIDYYDLSYEWGADPHISPFKRLITIMHASDY